MNSKCRDTFVKQFYFFAKKDWMLFDPVADFARAFCFVEGAAKASLGFFGFGEKSSE